MSNINLTYSIDREDSNLAVNLYFPYSATIEVSVSDTLNLSGFYWETFSSPPSVVDWSDLTYSSGTTLSSVNVNAGEVLVVFAVYTAEKTAGVFNMQILGNFTGANSSKTMKDAYGVPSTRIASLPVEYKRRKLGTSARALEIKRDYLNSGFGGAQMTHSRFFREADEAYANHLNDNIHNKAVSRVNFYPNLYTELFSVFKQHSASGVETRIVGESEANLGGGSFEVIVSNSSLRVNFNGQLLVFDIVPFSESSYNSVYVRFYTTALNVPLSQTVYIQVNGITITDDIKTTDQNLDAQFATFVNNSTVGPHNAVVPPGEKGVLLKRSAVYENSSAPIATPRSLRRFHQTFAIPAPTPGNNQYSLEFQTPLDTIAAGTIVDTLSHNSSNQDVTLLSDYTYYDVQSDQLRGQHSKFGPVLLNSSGIANGGVMEYTAQQPPSGEPTYIPNQDF